MPDGTAPRRIAVIYGTRPEAVKLAPLVARLGPAARLIHSGQHYDAALAAEFEAGLGLPAPAVRLTIGGQSRGRQIGEAVAALGHELAKFPVDAVIVQGDTNTALAGALAANAAAIPLVHVEAGLRSFDRSMPEEHNRVLIDHLCDLACAPTEGNRAHLVAEGIPHHRIVVTGNTVVESLTRLRPGPVARAALLRGLGLEHDRFALATFHRPENVDTPEALEAILRNLAGLPLPVLLPLHPRTAGRARAADLDRLLEKVRVVAPLGYAEFIGLMDSAAVIVTDSGGIQEEASVLKRPVVVVRHSTERPEVVGSFATLIGDAEQLEAAVGAWLADPDGTLARLAALPCPFGDEHAAERTVCAIDALLA